MGFMVNKLLTQAEHRALLNALADRKARSDWTESYPGERRDLGSAHHKLVTEYERRIIRGSYGGPVSHTPRSEVTPAGATRESEPQVVVSVEYIPPGQDMTTVGPETLDMESGTETLLPSFEDLNFEGWEKVPPFRKPKAGGK